MGAISLLVAIVLVRLISWLSIAIQAARYKLKTAKLEVHVMAAEKMFGPSKGAAKRGYVKERMKEAGLLRDQGGLSSLSREDMEAAVFRLFR